MSIDPNIWGPHAWAFLHLIPLSENDSISTERLKQYDIFYNTLTHLLPCSKCRKHLEKNLSEMPSITTLKNKKDLFNWTVDLHNKINKSNGKKVEDNDKMYKLWTDISQGKKNFNGKYCFTYYLKYMILLILVVLILILFITNISKVLRKN